MAEINMPEKSGKRKKHDTRIDLTPMVDLGFLLISFFMITTTLAKPRTMDINMPSTEGPSTPWTDTSTITLIPVKGHCVIYYNGALTDKEQLKETPIGNIRAVLMKKESDLKNLPASFSAPAHILHVLIKPNNDCKYDDVVRMLDEMNICAIPYYAIVDLAPQEKEWISK